MGLNPSSHHSKTGCSEAGRPEVGHSEASYLELKAERVSPVPSREASEDHSEAASDGGIQDQGCFDFQQDQVKWNLSGIVDMMRNDLDVMEVVILDHVATILYVGQ